MTISDAQWEIAHNPEKYIKLLTDYLPKIIRTEAENEEALAIVEKLMHKECSPEEDELYQLLITLIEKFEQEYYQLNEQTSSQSMLLFLLEQSAKTTDDLNVVLGSKNLIEQILNGQQEITSEQAQKLGNFFHVEPSLFT
ncbi:MAG: helix-turn-helix domain-containing protein [Trichormus sp.]